MGQKTQRNLSQADLRGAWSRDPATSETVVDVDVSIQVWSSYFSLAVLFINQPSLQLETLSGAKRKKVLDR